jgi:hypothetical protein
MAVLLPAGVSVKATLRWVQALNELAADQRVTVSVLIRNALRDWAVSNRSLDHERCLRFLEACSEVDLLVQARPKRSLKVLVDDCNRMTDLTPAAVPQG